MPIGGSFSIDPAVLVDDDDNGSAYLYFGGIWGGQLQVSTTVVYRSLGLDMAD